MNHPPPLSPLLPLYFCRTARHRWACATLQPNLAVGVPVASSVTEDQGRKCALLSEIPRQDLNMRTVSCFFCLQLYRVTPGINTLSAIACIVLKVLIDIVYTHILIYCYVYKYIHRYIINIYFNYSTFIHVFCLSPPSMGPRDPDLIVGLVVQVVHADLFVSDRFTGWRETVLTNLSELYSQQTRAFPADVSQQMVARVSSPLLLPFFLFFFTFVTVSCSFICVCGITLLCWHAPHASIGYRCATPSF